MTEPGSHEASALVQLGFVEVAPTLVEESAGNRLDALLGPAEGLDVRVDVEQWSRLPHDGWRRVLRHELPSGLRQVLAAPHPAGGWVLVNVLDRKNGEALLVSADPEPVHVGPGRATRRAPLVLHWPAPVVTVAGSVPELQVELINTGPARWTNDAEDRGHVAAWVQDLTGQRVPEASPWVLTNGSAMLPDLEPGQSIHRPVMLQGSGIDQLPAGHYQLDAALVSLDLHTEPTPLHLT